MRHILYSMISFIVAIFFIMLGVISIMIPWSPSVRTDLIQFLLEDSIAIILFGICLVAIGVAIVVSIILNAKPNYYHLKVGGNSVQIDETIIQTYLNSYWQELFPDNDIPNRLVLKKNNIHVIADLPYVAKPQQEVILDRIKTDLREIFGKLLGYHHHFYLTASFQPEKKS